MVNNQQRMEFANSANLEVVMDILSRVCGSRSIVSLIGKDEYSTLVNAITVEVETQLLKNFANELDAIKKGQIYDN